MRAKEQEDGHDDPDRLLHAPQVQHDQAAGHRHLDPKFPILILVRRRENVEDLIHARGDGRGHGQDVIDQQRAAGNQAEIRPEQLARDSVAAAAIRKVLDQAAVGPRDDRNRDGRGDRQRDRQLRVVAATNAKKGAKRLVRAVCAGTQPVDPQAHPGQKRDERDRMEKGRVIDVPRFAKEHLPEAGGPPVQMLFHLGGRRGGWFVHRQRGRGNQASDVPRNLQSSCGSRRWRCLSRSHIARRDGFDLA